ncbi:MAG: RNA 2',3'-cyclic phosphodiesterase [Chitinispirillaceae bacterium]|nr:RNA 2',3'-cyclic phosphodiesterase [Chitinispirillaceae bacterium]
MKRLFLSIDLPQRIIDDIGATYRAIHGARWMSEKQLHITLRFYGATPPEREEDLIKALQEIAVPPFPLRLKGVGHFPPRGEPRILWAGIAPEKRLVWLASLVENVSVKAGFAREKRAYAPHITVARLHGVSHDRVAQYLVSNSLFLTEPFEVRDFHLYASHLGKAGATYDREVSFTLEAPRLTL